jgi:hypothetical protein
MRRLCVRLMAARSRRCPARTCWTAFSRWCSSVRGDSSFCDCHRKRSPTRPLPRVRAVYGIFIRVSHNAHPAVFVPILVIAGVFALLVLLSTIAAKQRICRCLLPMGSAIGIVLALGEVFLGIAAWAKPARIDSWIADMERNSPESVPMTVSKHFDAHHRTVAIVLWCLASLQFVRATVSLVVECHHWRQGRKHAGGYLQAGEDNFYVDGRVSGHNYVAVGEGGRSDRTCITIHTSICPTSPTAGCLETAGRSGCLTPAFGPGGVGRFRWLGYQQLVRQNEGGV